jgi:hypothetical protein
MLHAPTDLTRTPDHDGSDRSANVDTDGPQISALIQPFLPLPTTAALFDAKGMSDGGNSVTPSQALPASQAVRPFRSPPPGQAMWAIKIRRTRRHVKILAQRFAPFAPALAITARFAVEASRAYFRQR